MFQITIPLLYIIAGIAFIRGRVAGNPPVLLGVAFAATVIGVIEHIFVVLAPLFGMVGFELTLGNAASFVGLQLALIAAVGSFEARLRGLSGGLLLLAAVASAFTSRPAPGTGGELTWQIQAHVLISLFAYGLLTVDALVAVYALVQDTRLRAGRLSAVNQLFAPLETNEKLLYGIAASGFTALLIAVVSGLAFVDDMFAQHLVHKSTLSLVALVLFGALIAGRLFAGWRGRRAVYLYLWGFLVLGLAYFGSRFILEIVLGRSWG